MTNREKYAKKILDIVCGGQSVGVYKNTGEPFSCDKSLCDQCLLSDIIYKKMQDGEEMSSCAMAFKNWCEQEYDDLSKWNSVPVDTPILVRDSNFSPWIKRYFAKYENRKVFSWADGRTSWSRMDDADVTYWSQAKLTE